MATAVPEEKVPVMGYLPQDKPPVPSMISLGIQQVLTMFPATVLVAILTKFDVATTLLASGIGTIVALLVTKRRIPMYYGSSFSYISVIITAMVLYDPECFKSAETFYCPNGVRIAQVGIIGTGVVEILIGLLIMRIGKAALDKVLPPIITGYRGDRDRRGVSRCGAQYGRADWGIAIVTLFFTVMFSVYLQGKGLLGMLPILLGAIVGYVLALLLGKVNFALVSQAQWFQVPNITLPDFTNPNSWAVVLSISLIAIATIPESTAHLYQMSLYIDALAKELKRAPLEIKKLIGLNLVADGADDIVVGMLGGCAGHELRREQQPDGDHAQLLGAGADDGRRHRDSAGLRRQVGGAGQHDSGGGHGRPGDLPVRRDRHAGRGADPIGTRQPVRAAPTGGRIDHPDHGHRRQSGAEGWHLPLPDSDPLPERHPGDRVCGADRHSAQSGVPDSAAVEVRREGTRKHQLRIKQHS